MNKTMRIVSARLRHPDFDEPVEFLIGHQDPMIDDKQKVVYITADGAALIVTCKDEYGDNHQSMYQGYQYDATMSEV